LYVDVTRLITEYGSDFVVFDAIELAGSNQEVLITIRGQSDTRGNLLAFEKRILSDNRFEDFKLPIGVLTKQENLSFNVTFKYHEN